MDKPKEESKNLLFPNSISCSVTWVDGRIIFKDQKKYSKFFYGICSFSKNVFAVTPLDYIEPTMITGIDVSVKDGYCQRSRSCLNFNCELNRFNRSIFLEQFKDCGSFSLSLPNDIGSIPLWFTEPQWEKFWEKLLIPVHGGTLKFKEGNKEVLL